MLAVGTAMMIGIMPKKKNPVAQAMAALRHKSQTATQRKEIARKAAMARWGRKKT
jgi:hypothetical protein